MAKQTPSSRTQDRILELLGFDFDGTYPHAARTLEDAGLPANGMISDLDAREIKKLSDEELRAMLPEAVEATDVKTTASIVAEKNQAVRDAKAARKQRVKTNDRLRAHGFRWIKTAGHADNIHPRDLDAMDRSDAGMSDWMLVDSSGNQTTVGAALAAIRRS